MKLPRVVPLTDAVRGRRLRPAALALGLTLAGGCTGPAEIEIRNEGPSAVAVRIVVFDRDEPKERVLTARIPKGDRREVFVGFHTNIDRLVVEAAWEGGESHRTTFSEDALPKGLAHAGSGGAYEGLSLAPDDFKGVAATPVRVKVLAWTLLASSLLIWGIARWAHRRSPCLR